MLYKKGRKHKIHVIKITFDGFHNLSRTWPHFTSGRWRHWRVVRTGINDTCRITDRSHRRIANLFNLARIESQK